MGLFNEWGQLLHESRLNFRDVGTVMPSSRFLGRELASELGGHTSPLRILEAGPGTGPVTRQILTRLLPEDRLDLVELNKSFVELLERRFRDEPFFRLHAEQVRIICAPLESLEGAGAYDLIVSCLPLNNFPPGLVRTIFKAFKRLLKPGGMLSFFEYAYLRQLKTPFMKQLERRRLSHVGRILGKNIRSFQLRQNHILLNVPPAIVHHLRFQQA
jgi:phosphatidylethanolamine/phosphatidyl-N-methylethanolamine N-methyltransferase